MNIMFHILIVEDNSSVRSALRTTLSRLGCHVTTAVSAENGIELMKVFSFDAVFAALCVREKGGRSVARWVKAQSPTTRVFLVTSWKGDFDRTLLNFEGIHDVVRTPLQFNELRDKLIENLG
jgi:DNA-binding response OmpR family regulator